MSPSSANGPIPPDQNLGPTFLILTCILTFFSITATSLRIWVRKVNYTLGWDDYLIGVVTVLAVARMALQVVSVHYGNGRHRYYLTDAQNRFVVMASWYTQLILFPTICLLKTSICLLLLRIKNTRRLRWAMYGIIAGLVLTNLEPEIVLLAECSPVKAYWEPSAGHCWDSRVRIYSIYLQAAYSIVTDLICSLLPVVVVYNIKIRLKDKILVCGLMSMGLAATACAAVRASSLGLATDDLSYAYCIAAIWANTELHLGILGANAACSRSIYKYLRHGKIRSTSTSSGSDQRLSHNRSGYMRSQDPPGTIMQYPSNTYNKIDSSRARSMDSEIPLYDTSNIKKTVDFSVTTNNLQSSQEDVKFDFGTPRDPSHQV